MFVIYGFALLVVVGVVLCLRDYEETGIGIVLASVLMCATLGTITVLVPKDGVGEPRRSEFKLRCLVRGEGGELSGDFFLGCGSVRGSTERFFWYYIERDDGAVLYQEAPWDNVLVYEDGKKLAVHYHGWEYFDWWWGHCRVKTPRRSVELHIPAGSVLEKWNP